MPFSFKSLRIEGRPDKINEEALRDLLRRARFIHPEDAEFANTLWPHAADFLSSNSLRALIRDEIEEEKITNEIRENQEFLHRLSSLLPSLSDLFNPENPENLEGFTSCVDDCCGDYRASRDRSRKDRLIREAHEVLSSAAQYLTNAGEAIEAAKRYIESDYATLHEAYFGSHEDTTPEALARAKRMHGRSPSVQLLTEEMRVCRAVLDIAQAKASIDPETLFISGNDGKNLIVRYAHTMSLMWNGPRITTTPGSDFAFLCSILFECATGTADESLAGAINRYARSSARHKHEAEEEEFRRDEASEDNFADEKQQIRLAVLEIEDCKALIDSEALDGFARAILLLNARKNLRHIEALSKVLGPRQIRMSHLSQDQIAEIEPLLTAPRAIAALDIELGNLRRANKMAEKTAINPKSG
jgi:hypothetical protein